MSDERTEEATPHKLSEARKKGQLAKSVDLTTALVMATATAAMAAHLRGLLSDGVGLVQWAASRMPYAGGNLRDTAGELTVAAVPMATTTTLVIALVAGTALAVSAWQTGLNVSLEPLAPQLNRIDPLEGARRVFSSRGLTENLKTLLKAAVLVTIGVFAVWGELQCLAVLAAAFPADGLAILVDAARRVAWKMIVGMVVIAIVDYAWQTHSHKKSMRMSKQEVIDENKNQEGDPQAKARVKKMRRQMFKRLRLEGVKEARVIITNPTHYAVAVAYGGSDSEVPRVVAKGKGYRAQRIKAIAREHGIRIFEKPELARTLFRLVDVGKHVPPALYLAVAEILVLVNRLESEWAATTASRPRERKD